MQFSFVILLNVEISGKVQGVFFRKYTHAKAIELGIRGWVQNTPTGTVIGEAEGPIFAIESFKDWLSTKGYVFTILKVPKISLIIPSVDLQSRK